MQQDDFKMRFAFVTFKLNIVFSSCNVKQA